jgi:predicted ATPase
MTRLTLVDVANFKCFRRQPVELGALTVLSGLNGMGKSSLVQALLLLRQSFLGGRNRRLRLSGDLVDLGTGADVFFDLAEEDEIMIALETRRRADGAIVRVEYRFGYDRKAEVLRPLKQIESARSLPGPAITVMRGDKASPVSPRGGARSEGGALRSPLFSSIGFQYLSAERLGPRKMLPASEEHVRTRSLGSQGEYVLSVLAADGGSTIEAGDPRLKAGTDASTVLAQTTAWLQDTSPGSTLAITELRAVDAVSARFAYERQGDVPSKPFRATNVGFGLSYVLPVLVALLGARPGDLVIIENPEAHLHPRGQTRLGQLASRAAAAGVQVIVETHSDHFLDGVRIDVRQKRLPTQDVRVHYFTRFGPEAAVITPRITADGEMTEWPSGFFDEREDNLVRLLRPV